MRMPRRVARIGGTADEWLQPRWMRSGAPPDKCCSNFMRTRRQGQAHAPALVHLVTRLGHVDEVGFEVGFAAHLEAVDTLAVHRELDLVLVLEPTHDAQVGA